MQYKVLFYILILLFFNSYQTVQGLKEHRKKPANKT